MEEMAAAGDVSLASGPYAPSVGATSFSPGDIYADGFSLYQYANSSPVNYTDSFGLYIDWFDEVDALMADMAAERMALAVYLSEQGPAIAEAAIRTIGIAALEGLLISMCPPAGLLFAGAGLTAAAIDIWDEGLTFGNVGIAAANIYGLGAGARALKQSKRFWIGLNRTNAAYRGRGGPETVRGPYAHLEDGPSVGAGKDFTRAQKRTLRRENMRNNGGELRSDTTGEILVEPKQHKKGVRPPDNEAQIDHIWPKSKGGKNSYANAQVISRTENLAKSNK